MISEEAIREFKEIWRCEFGTELSQKDAAEKAKALLALFDAIYWPIRKEDFQKRCLEIQDEISPD